MNGLGEVSRTGEEEAGDIQFYPQNPVTQKGLAQTQAKVNDVFNTMRGNVEKILERDVKLSELDRRADLLEQGASQFALTTGKLERKCWWKNFKMVIVIEILVLLIFVILLFWAISRIQ
jgi:hypothetical protein